MRVGHRQALKLRKPIPERGWAFLLICTKCSPFGPAKNSAVRLRYAMRVDRCSPFIASQCVALPCDTPGTAGAGLRRRRRPDGALKANQVGHHAVVLQRYLVLSNIVRILKPCFHERPMAVRSSFLHATSQQLAIMRSLQRNSGHFPVTAAIWAQDFLPVGQREGKISISGQHNW